MLDKLFLAHPRHVGETYWQHMRQAMSFAGHLALASLACAMHALIPSLFETTASRRIARLHDRMVRNRTGRRSDAVARSDGEHVFDFVI